MTPVLVEAGRAHGGGSSFPLAKYWRTCEAVVEAATCCSTMKCGSSAALRNSVHPACGIVAGEPQRSPFRAVIVLVWLTHPCPAGGVPKTRSLVIALLSWSMA